MVWSWRGKKKGLDEEMHVYGWYQAKKQVERDLVRSGNNNDMQSLDPAKVHDLDRHA